MKQSKSVIDVIQERALVVGNRTPSAKDVNDIAQALSSLVKRLKKVNRIVPEVDFSPNVKEMLKAVASAKVFDRPKHYAV